ncbi:helix-turn-helix domain-containing protein [Terracidiphilus sp.]|jgi:HTH-type transcriptional regulator/antitoxin HigA|uniref:helix-turn-helix domain-containing protein n=1 Tax=Terracidiphilus sp. TaxID=1964191 RepID=UPI003C150ED0
MDLKPIKNDADHEAALRQIERLWNVVAGTPESDHLEVLMTLAEAYEEANFPIDLPDPIEAIKFRLEQKGEDMKALIGILGNRTRVYEVMRGDRALSLAMIRRLNAELHIPAEVLIQPVHPRRRKKAA